jgi:hypothetical protein
MKSLLDHFQDGGYGMWPTLLFGIIFLAAAAAYARAPRQKLVPLLVALGTLTFSAGLLGFVTGMITTARALVREPDLPPIVAFFGAGEALNCVGLALITIVLAVMAISYGAWKIAREPEGAASGS